MGCNPELCLLVGFSEGLNARKAVREELKECGNGGSDNAVGVPDRTVVVVACGKGR